MLQKNGWSSGSRHTKPPPSKIYALTQTFLQIILAARLLVRHSSTSPKQQRRPLSDSFSIVRSAFFLSSLQLLFGSGFEYPRADRTTASQEAQTQEIFHHFHASPTRYTVHGTYSALYKQNNKTTEVCKIKFRPIYLLKPLDNDKNCLFFFPVIAQFCPYNRYWERF